MKTKSKTFVTDTAVVTIITKQTTDDRDPIDHIKDYVAEIKGTRAYDEVFDTIHQIGMSGGTQAFDSAMDMALEEMQIDPNTITEMLRKVYK